MGNARRQSCICKKKDLSLQITSTEGIELEEASLWVMKNNKAFFKGKTGGGIGTNQYQVRGSGKQRQAGNGKTVSCKWLTLKDGRKLCMGSDGNYYTPKSAQGQAQVDNWKPFGTEKEAEDFTKDSKIKDTLFHGTTSISKEGIEKEGFSLEKSAIGRNLGNGIYMTSIIRDADWYSKLVSSKQGKGDTPSIVKMKVNVKNPLVLDDAKFEQMRNAVAKKNKIETYTKEGFAIDSGIDKATKIFFDNLEKEGYDALSYKGSYADYSHTVVVFNPKNIMTFR